MKPVRGRAPIFGGLFILIGLSAVYNSKKIVNPSSSYQQITPLSY